MESQLEDSPERSMTVATFKMAGAAAADADEPPSARCASANAATAHPAIPPIIGRAVPSRKRPTTAMTATPMMLSRVGIAALRSILERHGEKVLAAMVLSVTIPERIDAELKELRAKWTQVVFVASSKSEAVMQGLDQFVRGLKHAVDERAKAALP